MSEAESPRVVVSVNEGIGIVRIDRPEVLNALDSRTMRELTAAVAGVAEDKAVRCVVLTGAGRAFCAGGDRSAMNSAKATRAVENSTAADRETRVQWIADAGRAALLLHEMPKPTIAMINGACAGAGMSLAAACDFRIAARSAIFVPAFLAMGMPGDYGGSWFWTRILGAAKSRELYYLIDRMNADDARAFGLVNRVEDDEALEGAVMATAKRLAAMPATSAGFAKQNLNAALHCTAGEAIRQEAELTVAARAALIELRKRSQ